MLTLPNRAVRARVRRPSTAAYSPSSRPKAIAQQRQAVAKATNELVCAKGKKAQHGQLQAKQQAQSRQHSVGLAQPRKAVVKATNALARALARRPNTAAYSPSSKPSTDCSGLACTNSAGPRKTPLHWPSSAAPGSNQDNQ